SMDRIMTRPFGPHLQTRWVALLSRLVLCAAGLITSPVSAAVAIRCETAAEESTSRPTTFFEAYDSAVALFQTRRGAPNHTAKTQADLSALLVSSKDLAQSRLGYSNSSLEARAAVAVLFVTWNTITESDVQSGDESLPIVLAQWFDLCEALHHGRAPIAEGISF